MDPDLRERGIHAQEIDGAGAVVVGDLALDHGLVVGPHLAGEVEAEVCSTCVGAVYIADREDASRQGIIDVSPAGRLAGSQRKYCGQGQPGCSDPPGDSPAG